MGNLRMKLNAVNRKRMMLDGRMRTCRGARECFKPLGQLLHLVSMAHPNVDLRRKSGE